MPRITRVGLRRSKPIWRGLRRLQADPDIGEWGRRFPTERMIQLTEAVDRLKSSAA